MQANEAPQERMSAAWRLHKRGYEPRRGSVMVKTIDATTTDPLEAHTCVGVILQAALRLHGATISRRRRRWQQSLCGILYSKARFFSAQIVFNQKFKPRSFSTE